jgi:hypothetical protein
MRKAMKLLSFSVLLLLSSVAFAADDEQALKEQMYKACAPLFVEGGVCAKLGKGTRNCARANLDKAGSECARFGQAHRDFFNAGSKDAPVKKDAPVINDAPVISQ